MTTTAEKLRAAKALIEDPEQWCRGSYALNANGKKDTASSDRAVRWCAVGAARKARVGVSGYRFLKQAAVNHGYLMPVELNDKTNHPTVMKMFERAIELAEQADG